MQGLPELSRIMKIYHHSMKHTFASFVTELVTTSWKSYNRDRSSGQICRSYIDAGNCIENHRYEFKVRIKNQTNSTLHLTGVDFRSRAQDRKLQGQLNSKETYDFDETHPVTVEIDYSKHVAAAAALTPAEELLQQEQQHEHETTIVLHPHAIRRVNIVITATRPCESFEMLQFQGMKPVI